MATRLEASVRVKAPDGDRVSRRGSLESTGVAPETPMDGASVGAYAGSALTRGVLHSGSRNSGVR